MKPEEMIGKYVYPNPWPSLWGFKIERVIKKAFPNDNESTLWVVKLKGKRGYCQIYEDEML